MTGPVTHEPPVPGSADDARTAILEQHETIRSLLNAAGTVARLAGAGNDRVADLLPAYLDRVRVALEEHLAFEDRLLVPILAADPPLGPERARRLHEEHARQRAELEVLARPSAEGREGRVVTAARLGALSEAFLADMEAEERLLLTRDVLRDDVVSVEQDDG
jgi:hypothetical protein